MSIGAFAQGFARSFNFDQLAKYAMNRDIREAQALAEEDAQKMRETQINKNIQEVGIGGPQGDVKTVDLTNPAANGLRFKVGDEEFSTREDARKAAERAAPPVESFLTKTQYPRLMKAYSDRGDMENAEKIRALMESQRGKEATAQYAKGLSKLMMGDINTGVKEIGKFYNDYVDDGVEWTSGEATNDGKVKIKLRARDGGKEGEVEMTPSELSRIAMAYDPAALVKQNLIDIREAEKAKAQALSEVGKMRMQTAKEIAVESFKQQGRIELDDKKFERDVNRLRESGYDDAFIRSIVPSLIGADTSGPYRKGPSPEETILTLKKYRMENDREFKYLSPEKQAEALKKDYQDISRLAQETTGSRPQASGVGQPPAGAAGQPASAPPAAKGLPVLDQRTGKVIYR